MKQSDVQRQPAVVIGLPYVVRRSLKGLFYNFNWLVMSHLGERQIWSTPRRVSTEEYRQRLRQLQHEGCGLPHDATPELQALEVPQYRRQKHRLAPADTTIKSTTSARRQKA